MNNATNAFYNDLRADQMTKAVWGFSAVTHFNFGENDASKMAFTDHTANRYLKAAFIITDAYFSELARQYFDELESLGNTWRNRLLFSLKKA